MRKLGITCLCLLSLNLFADSKSLKENLTTKGIETNQIKEIIEIYNQLLPEVQQKMENVFNHPYVKENFATLFLQNYNIEKGNPNFRALSAIIDTEESLLVMLWLMFNKDPTGIPDQKNKPNPVFDWDNALIKAQGRTLAE